MYLHSKKNLSVSSLFSDTSCQGVGIFVEEGKNQYMLFVTYFVFLVLEGHHHTSIIAI